MNNHSLWLKAVAEHNKGEYFEAHEIFEDLWLETDNREEKDIIQTLAQVDALAVHIQTENERAAQRLMGQLPELLQNFPDTYRDINLVELREWVADMISRIPRHGKFPEISNKVPPKLLDS